MNKRSGIGSGAPRFHAHSIDCNKGARRACNVAIHGRDRSSPPGLVFIVLPKQEITLSSDIGLSGYSMSTELVI